MAKQTTKLTKKVFDAKVAEFLLLKEQKEAIDAKLKDLQTSLESQYALKPEEIEIVRGKDFLMEKVPVNKGKNDYDAVKVEAILKPIGKVDEVIQTVKIVDVKAFNGLVKAGFIAPESQDACRNNKWTFKSMFKRIEEVVQAVTTGKKKAV
jgi:transcriptional regulator of aromatic amino acid metabolism